MIFKEDVIARITADFGEDAPEAMSRLNEAINETDCLNTDRIIRCIVFLAAGNLQALDKYIKAAIIDTRDVILWAEYAPGSDERIRDFNIAFENGPGD